MAISRLMSRFVEGSAKELLKRLSILGFSIGIILLVTGVAVLASRSWGFDVWFLLILTGLSLVLRPLNRFPWAALFGAIAGIACVGLLHLYFPLPETLLDVSSAWIYLVIFLAPAIVVYLIFKSVEDLTRLLGFVLASRPMTIVLGILCIMQGVLLLFSQSLLQVLF